MGAGGLSWLSPLMPTKAHDLLRLAAIHAAGIELLRQLHKRPGSNQRASDLKGLNPTAVCSGANLLLPAGFMIEQGSAFNQLLSIHLIQI